MDRLQHPSPQWYADEVVDESPKEVLVNGRYGPFRKSNGLGDFLQIARNERHFGLVHGNVGSCYRGDTHICLGECVKVTEIFLSSGILPTVVCEKPEMLRALGILRIVR